MDVAVSYTRGTSPRRINLDAVLDAITDQVLADGDVEKALQRVFRFGTEGDMGLLDILDHLRNETQEDLADIAPEIENHDAGMELTKSDRRSEDTVAMREALRQVESLDDLQNLDPQLMDRTLSTEKREWIEKWADMTGQLLESGLVAMSGPRLVLTAKAIRQIGSRLLQHMFLPPTLHGRGHHLLHRPGLHGSATDETTAWEWGKPLDLHVARSLMQAVRHTQERDGLHLRTDDFEVFERESGAAIVTVLLVDMSRSMFESGAWDIAKRAAIALNTLMETRGHLDELILIGFSGDARMLNVDELPSISWDQYSHGTNLHAGLRTATRSLERFRSMNRQVVIITDGEPTAFLDAGKPTFEHPVTERTIGATLLEAKRMERRNIAFTMICIGESEGLPAFAQTFSRTVSGRLIQLPLDQLGAFIVRDIASGSHRVVG